MTEVTTADGVRLALHGRNEGTPFVFQHGLGGDHHQTFETCPDLPGIRLTTLECRAHGQSDRAGPFAIAQFADDVAAIVPDGAVLGGISMGAAIAARLAVRRRKTVKALILVRPAWTTVAAPDNMLPVAEVAALIGNGKGAKAFMSSATCARLALDAPDNVASLLGYFVRPDPATTALLLGDIAGDGPGISPDDLRAVRLPTLVIGCDEDAIHPFAHAAALASLIPGAELVRVPPKGRGKAAHLCAVHAAIADFLKEH